MAEVYVGNRYFRTKQELFDYLQLTLYKYVIGESLSLGDKELILHLLPRHPSFEQKVGCGITDITVQIHPTGYGSRCFWLLRTDGSGTDVSFRKCIRPPTRRQELQAAFRRAVADDITWFKTRHFNGTNYAVCPITGKTYAFSELQVHHRPPFDFKTLVDNCLTLHGLKVSDIELVSTDGMAGKRLANRVLTWAWRQYHETWANLQLISHESHIAITMDQLRTRSQNDDAA